MAQDIYFPRLRRQLRLIFIAVAVALVIGFILSWFL